LVSSFSPSSRTKRHFTSVVNATPAAMQLNDLAAKLGYSRAGTPYQAHRHYRRVCGARNSEKSASSLALVAVDSSLNKTINKAGEGVPISELPIARGACSATALHNDEFDDLLLEVVVFRKAQSTAEK
jgi:hypothetical protein